MFFHSNSGVLQVAIGEPPTPAPYNSGYSFTNLERMYVIPWDPAAPLPSDTVYSGGLARSAKGALYVYEGTPSATQKGLGVPARTNNGICFVTTGAIGSGSTFTSPWGMVSSSGQVHVDASFGLGFADLGAGVVSIVAGLSGATPTFTRATDATTVLSNGLIGTVASGSPRSYYDPTTLQYLGYLAEGARTNLLLRSSELDDAAWTKVDATITPNALVSPDGTSNADLVTEGAAGTASVAQSVTATADVSYAVSRWFKRGNTDWVFMRFGDGSNQIRGWWNLNTGTVGTPANVGTATGAAATIQAFPNGWYRCVLTGTVGSGVTAVQANSFTATADGSVTRVNNGTYNTWGAQFENNVSFASSYIATVGTTVTRNQDVLTYPTAGWFNETTGTFLSRNTYVNFQSAGSIPILTFSDGTANERTQTEYSGGNAPRLSVRDGGVEQGPVNFGAITQGTPYKLACAYAANDLAGSLNGTAVVTDTSATLPSGITTLGVGIGSFNAYNRIAFFPTRLANAQLVAMTQ